MKCNEEYITGVYCMQMWKLGRVETPCVCSYFCSGGARAQGTCPNDPGGV
jgi:hypothetical protein